MRPGTAYSATMEGSAPDMKVLVVTPNAQRHQALGDQFFNYDPECIVERAESGFFALTMIERDMPDVIVADADVSDMTGQEFLEILRDDESMAQISVVLLDENAKASFAASEHEVILAKDAADTEILAAATRILQKPRLEHNLNAPLHGEVLAERPADNVKLQGTLEVISLFDLVLSLTQKANSGRLYVLLGSEESAMFFEGGRFVHAEYGKHTGEDALAQTFSAVDNYQNAEFYYQPSSEKLPKEARTLDRPVQELLLQVAIHLDHSAVNQS